VSEVGCLGLCHAEPLVDVNVPGTSRIVYGNVGPEHVEEIVTQHIQEGRPLKDLALGTLGQTDDTSIESLWEHPMLKPQHRIALRNAGILEPGNIHQYIANDGYSALNRALRDLTPDEVREEVSKSGLRGRGGAAFPTGTKWNFLAGSSDPVKYILVNCEEGDPGAFNDKGILESDPHSLLEGIVIAGLATGASFGYVFIRNGHQGPIERTWRAINEARQVGVLGLNILGSDFSFDVEVALTGDSYVSGEETALMESIEGKRGIPRLRPPYVAEVGLFGRPTLEHNMETLHWVRDIVEKGAKSFSEHGRRGRKGLRAFSVSGRVNKPGVHLAPAGISIRELIDEYCDGMQPGHKFYGYFPGGASGGILPASLGDAPLDFDTLQEYGCFIGSAAVIVFSEKDAARDLALNAMRFFEHESCGQCTPCRSGTSKAIPLMKKDKWDKTLLEELSRTMEDASICGLGQAAPNPLRSVIKYFPQEV